MTISIEHMDKISPETAKGFNFTENQKVVQKTTKDSSPLQGGAPTLLILLFLGLPLGIWIAIIARASKGNTTNIIEFPTKSEDDEHDHDYPQAS